VSERKQLLDDLKEKRIHRLLRKDWLAHCGGLVSEENMDLSQATLREE
jgi:hypothetical protein